MVVEIFPVAGLPEIEPGDDLAALLVEAVAPLHPRDGDILVVTHKVVSKAEGALARQQAMRTIEMSLRLRQRQSSAGGGKW